MCLFPCWHISCSLLFLAVFFTVWGFVRSHKKGSWSKGIARRQDIHIRRGICLPVQVYRSVNNPTSCYTGDFCHFGCARLARKNSFSCRPFILAAMRWSETPPPVIFLPRWLKSWRGDDDSDDLSQRPENARASLSERRKPALASIGFLLFMIVFLSFPLFAIARKIIGLLIFKSFHCLR